MMENQSMKLPLKSVTKHAQRFTKALRAKNKLKKNFNKKAKAEIYGYYMRVSYIKMKQEASINNELKKLRLAKLANNNISESDMINISCIACRNLETNFKTNKY